MIHTTQKDSLKCEICSQILKDDNNFKLHVKSCKIYGKLMRKTDTAYLCLKCPTKISSRSGMIHHVRKHHMSEDELEKVKNGYFKNSTFKKCEICGQSLKEKPYLFESHVKACTFYTKFMRKTVNAYQCLKCPKKLQVQ